MITTMTEKELYRQEDLLAAIGMLPEKEAENILAFFKLSTVLTFINLGSEADREQLKNSFSETLHRELDIYNGMNRLYDMLPVIDHKVYIDNGIVQKNENTSSESACDNQTDVVE